MAVFLFSLVIGFAMVRAGYLEARIVGIQGGQLQPLILGILSVITSIVLVTVVALQWRRWRDIPRAVMTASVLVLLVHVYGVLPPHRNLGIPAVLLAVLWSVVTFVWAWRAHSR